MISVIFVEPCTTIFDAYYTYVAWGELAAFGSGYLGWRVGGKNGVGDTERYPLCFNGRLTYVLMVAWVVLRGE